LIETDALQTTPLHRANPSEVTILARVLSQDNGRLSRELAHYLLTVGFSDGDKNRMHDLAIRNQDGALSPAEKDELSAYAKAGTLLSILKSKARRALREKGSKRTSS
jgi:hypothetical protein